MTKIAPFKGVFYNQEKIKDLLKVVCPPYDVISPNRQQYYYDLDLYNFIHILLPQDSSDKDKYRRAGRIFKEWLKDRIFIQDEKPAIYFYSQEYNLKGEKRTRLGFISLLRLEEGKPSVFGHEHTRLEPKEDRLRLLKQVKANLSPIFAVFSDRKRIIQSTYEQCIQGVKPFIDIIDDEKTVHKLWRLNSPEHLNKIESCMSRENIFIADGHHRYEVACAFRDELKKRKGPLFLDESSVNYIMSYFTNVESRGLVILPIHRLVKLNANFDFNDFQSGLKDYFDLDQIKDKSRLFFLLEKAGASEHVLGMYFNKKYWLLRLKNIKLLDKLFVDKPKIYRSLDIAILNFLILKMILKIDLEDKQNIVFSADATELIGQEENLGRYVAFFLNPVKIQEIITVALSGEKMPSKSTYFYPKVLSGLVIHKFNT
jgi:uncharacterized protein (DUF1015 family)